MSSAGQTKIEILRRKIDERKACEKKAFETCVKLIEANQVDDETLIQSANQIDRERYRGVNEDRSLRQTCGYPVCSNGLPDEKPKGQFYIDVRVNKVIDTTERRLFCSTFCYKASKYYERQIHESPVWARDESHAESVRRIELLTRETLHKETRDESTIISQTISHRPRPPSSSSSSSSDDEFEELQIARDQYYKNRQNLKKKPTFVESKLRQGKLPEPIRTENETIDYVLTCLYEWITTKTREFLNDPTVKTSNLNEIDQKRYENLVRRIEIDQINDSTGQRAERGLPTVEQLQQGQYAIKVKEFLCGKTREEEPLPIVLPPVDSISQQSIRLSIVNEKVQTCFKIIFADRIETKPIRDVRSTLADLLLTFDYQSDNITLKPNEWTIMTLFLSFLSSMKTTNVVTSLGESKLIDSLLRNIGISTDLIIKTLKFLLDDRPIPQTNFTDVD